MNFIFVRILMHNGEDRLVKDVLTKGIVEIYRAEKDALSASLRAR